MRYFIEIGYEGTAYHGWQLQPNAVTVQEHIEKALSVLLKAQTEISGAGRTDAGVHAEQLFAHFDTTEEIDKTKFNYQLNAILPDDIVIYDIFKVRHDVHARFDAVSRSYEYRIYLGKNPFLIATSYQILSKKLNIVKMNEACKILVSFSDFKCFSRSNTDVKTYLCTIHQAAWTIDGKMLIFNITANRFLRNMVRAIVGTMLDIGTGKTSLEEFKQIIKGQDRSEAGPSAPARGLFLTKVEYPKSIRNHE